MRGVGLGEWVEIRLHSKTIFNNFTDLSTNIHSRVKQLFFILLLLCSRSILTGQQSSFLQEIKQDSALHLYLRQDWKNIEKHKKDKVYQSADVRLVTATSDTIAIPAKVRTRGNMRLEICSLPPLKLKFEKADLQKHGLSPLNEMDIVEPCHDDDTYDQCLLKEYMAYKLWELVSPYYFRTQLLQIHYTNPDGTEAHDPSYAFFVENTEELVERLGGRRNKTPVISSNAVDKEPMLMVALFEFMIGNTDWFIQNRHNLEFVVIPGHSFLVTIPYDFDYSGLVAASYAAHHESLKLTSVASRYYQGWCFPEADVEKALEVFLQQKENILKMPYQIQGLNEKSASQARAYLSGFFEIIENPKKLDNQILKHCDMWPVKN